MDGAYMEMDRILQERPELPTAFFADNDIVALGAMKAFQKNGYRIPEDISLIGFDDLPFCIVSTPTLSTIRVFKQEMGQLAVRRLIELIRTDTKTKIKIQICNEFIERDSVCSLKIE
jgi:LacI family transcriptional regulator